MEGTGRNMNLFYRYLVIGVFGVIELVLTLRFFLKLFDASASNGFVNAMYSLADWSVKMFEGIFDPITVDSISSTAVFEPATLIVMVLLGLIAWVIVLFIPTTHYVKTSEYAKQG